MTSLHKPGYMKNKRPNYWLLAAVHFLLCIQKEFQRVEKTKGHTVLIFDHESREENNLAEIVLDPPEWTDTYYGYERDSRRKDNPRPLSHIIDVPYFVDSKHVGMLHIADLFSYLIRHFAELQAGYTKPQYRGEKDVVSDWLKELAQFMLPDSNRWVSRGACPCAKLFNDIAPDPLLRLHSHFKK